MAHSHGFPLSSTATQRQAERAVVATDLARGTESVKARRIKSGIAVQCFKEKKELFSHRFHIDGVIRINIFPELTVRDTDKIVVYITADQKLIVEVLHVGILVEVRVAPNKEFRVNGVCVAHQ